MTKGGTQSLDVAGAAARPPAALRPCAAQGSRLVAGQHQAPQPPSTPAAASGRVCRTVLPAATKILSRCFAPLPRHRLDTRWAQGSDLKASASSPFRREKHCTTPVWSPTTTFWVLCSPGGSTWVGGREGRGGGRLDQD